MPEWTIFKVFFLWKHQFLCFHLWDYLTNLWRNNWRFIINVVKRPCQRIWTEILHDCCLEKTVKNFDKCLTKLTFSKLLTCACSTMQCNGLKYSLEKHPHFYAPVFSRDFFREHSCYDSVEISRENTGVLKRKKIFPTWFQHILILHSFQNYAMKAAFIYFCKLYNKMNLLGAKS